MFRVAVGASRVEEIPGRGIFGILGRNHSVEEAGGMTLGLEKDTIGDLHPQDEIDRGHLTLEILEIQGN